MKFVLNIGMHKTGSSSIQHSLNGLDTNKAAYLKIGHPNHSSIYMTLFREQPETYSAHRKNNRSLDQVLALKDKFQSEFEKFVKSHQGKTILSSAEDVGLMTQAELGKMKVWLSGMFDQICIIGYVRAPISFMSSAMQQRIAGGVQFELEDLFPPYRDRFEKFDRVFGQENVFLAKFESEHLINGDVVADFMAKADVTLSPEKIKIENEGRSLEASAVLYAQRKLGRGFVRYSRAPMDNNRVVTLLRGIGTKKVALHPDYVGPILTERLDDLNWITQRLGVDIVDYPEDSADALKSPDDLLSIAGDYLPEVMDILKQEARELGKSDPEFVARAIDLLLDMVRARRERPDLK